MSRPPQGRAPHRRQSSRLLGYGADAGRQRLARARPKVGAAGNNRLTEFAAWLATTALAGALILLLAQFDPLLALPVLLVYALFSVLLWRGRREKTKRRA